MHAGKNYIEIEFLVWAEPLSWKQQDLGTPQSDALLIIVP